MAEALLVDSLRDVIPIVEAKLYDWGRCVLEYPDAPVSNIYRLLLEYGKNLPSKVSSRMSPQERWAMKHRRILDLARAVHNALVKMAPLERRVVELRYVARKTWAEIATDVNLSESHLKRVVRDRILYMFAAEFGLLAAEKEKEPQSL